MSVVTALRTAAGLAGAAGGARAAAGAAGGVVAGGAGAGFLARTLGLLNKSLPAVAALTMDQSKEDSDTLRNRLGAWADKKNAERDARPKTVEEMNAKLEELKKLLGESNIILRDTKDQGATFQRQNFSRDSLAGSGLIQKASLGGGDYGIARGSAGATSLGGPVDLNHTTPGQPLPGAGSGIIRNGGALGGGAGVGAYKQALDYIAGAEGTAGAPGGGYNTSLGYGKYLPGGQEQNLTGKSLNEILALGDHMRRQPGNPNSSALGRYQIVGSTLRGLMRKLGLNGSEKFDEALQDRLGAELIRQRGADARGLGNEWASLKGAKGQEAARIVAGIPSGSSTTPGARTASLGDPVAGSGDVIGRIGDLKRSGAISGVQCVDLVKAYTGDRSRVTSWRRGEGAAAGNLTPGTPVATFLNRDGSQSSRYAGGGTGTPGAGLDHAAIFQEYVKDAAGTNIGMKVIEQYAKTRGQQVAKTYMFGQGHGERNGSNYAAVLGADGNPLGGKPNPAEFTSSGWKPADVSRDAPSALQRNGRVAPGGGQGGKVNAPITVNGAQDPQQTAREIQRHVESLQGSRTHDWDYQTT